MKEASEVKMPYPQEVIDLGEKVKNWGRWGDGDERGTVN